MSCPTIITIDEFVKTATMFYIDKDLEKHYEEEVSRKCLALTSSLRNIHIIEGLKEYIIQHEDSLDNLTSLLNISNEKFKRIITMLRIKKGYMPTSEWDLKKIRNQMIENHIFMDTICDLLLNGANDDKYKTLIPGFYLENFKIDINTISRLTNPDDVKRLVKKGLSGKYNNHIGDSFYNYSMGVIKEICELQGITFSLKKEMPFYKNAFGMVVYNVSDQPRLVINFTYNITTASTQTKYANQSKEITTILRDLNENKNDDEKVIFIQIVDGAGWIARRSDLEKLFRSSDYVLNLNNIKAQMIELINYYL